jgi:hypothetical protein
VWGNPRAGPKKIPQEFWLPTGLVTPLGIHSQHRHGTQKRKVGLLDKKIGNLKVEGSKGRRGKFGNEKRKQRGRGKGEKGTGESKSIDS